MKYEALIRFGVFASVLAIIAALETLFPRRTRIASRVRRTINNLMLVGCASLLVRMIPALYAVGAATWAARSQFGALNLIETVYWIKAIIALLILDLAVYWQHVAFHRLPWAWRFHRVHHADLDLDGTSGLRFHPVEIILSMGVKVGTVILIGAPAEVVMLFEIGLNSASILSHGNIRLPLMLDRWLRLFIVTPDMHRVHHSIALDESQHNFSSNLPWWDWIFRTYRDQPQESHECMELGLPNVRSEAETVPLVTMLWMPFVASSHVLIPTPINQDADPDTL